MLSHSKMKCLMLQMKAEKIIVKVGKIFTLNYPLVYQVINNESITMNIVYLTASCR